jgi:hypothetical protein
MATHWTPKLESPVVRFGSPSGLSGREQREPGMCQACTAYGQNHPLGRAKMNSSTHRSQLPLHISIRFCSKNLGSIRRVSQDQFQIVVNRIWVAPSGSYLYEGGVRSSLVAWGPKIVRKQGLIDTESVFSAIDLAPTLLTLTGTPFLDGITLDGEALVDTLLGDGGSRSSPIFFRRPPDRDSFYGVDDLPDLAIRSGRWKLLCEYDGSDAELYNLQLDRSESTNVAAENLHIVAELTKSLLAWHKSMPSDNGATFRDLAAPSKGK